MAAQPSQPLRFVAQQKSPVGGGQMIKAVSLVEIPHGPQRDEQLLGRTRRAVKPCGDVRRVGVPIAQLIEQLQRQRGGQRLGLEKAHHLIDGILLG